MPKQFQERIQPGFQVFTADGDQEIGAVRIAPTRNQPELVIYVENAGEFTVALDAIKAVHFEKVMLDYDKLDGRLKTAIRHAHDSEEPGA